MKLFIKLFISAVVLIALTGCETTNGAASRAADSIRNGGAFCLLTPSIGGGTTKLLVANLDQEKGRRGGTVTVEGDCSKLTITSSGPESAPAK